MAYKKIGTVVIPKDQTAVEGAFVDLALNQWKHMCNEEIKEIAKHLICKHGNRSDLCMQCHEASN